MPALDKYGQKIPYPVLSDVPNAETAFGGLTNSVVAQSNMVFANANERAANLPEPVEGMETYLVAEQRKEIYRNGTWQAFVTATKPWLNVTLATGYTAYGGATVAPRVRQEGSIVYLEGRLKRTDNGNIPASNSIILGTIPLAYQPVGHYAEGFCSVSNATDGTPLARVEIWNGSAPTDPGTIRYWSDKPTAFVGFSSWWFVN